MEELESNSVQLIITSPPYGNIKDYGLDEQIGFFDSFEDYFKRLKSVWKECYRVLEPQCRMVINVGDQYLRTVDYGRYRILSIASEIINDCTALGFDFLGDVIWQKISTTNTTGGCSLMGSIYYPRNGLLTYDYEHILIFKKVRGKKKKVDLKTKELSKITLSEWKKWYTGHWRFPGIVQDAHLAMFPEELPYRIIRMFSFIGDTVLDPFVGSGTTLKVAKFLFRKGIGYEINQDFKPIINKKILEAKTGNFKDFQYLLSNIHQKGLSGHVKIDYEKQKQKGILILRDKNDSEIILDYMLFDDDVMNKESIIKEFKSKFEENTVQYYLKGKEGWNSCKNYVIVINAPESKKKEILRFGENHLNGIEFSKKIQLIYIDEVISEKFHINHLFQ
ncbi:MAG: site-specific DNA-methyltransferase [Promethearchaeota archaeon]|nr:MAG: site-specific DNA-methyltransferase [Candidatus Lokiarchaeota archaeon]